MNAEPLLEVRSLTAGYGDLVALRDVSFTVSRGEVVALFGSNGAGKTSTLLAIVGMIRRFGGEVVYRGTPSSAPLHRLARDGVAFVPEERSIVRSLSVRDNLRLGRGPLDAAVSHFPELARLLDRRAGLLSGGEQQMLTLGRALATGPQLLLVDELSLGLAPMVVERLLVALSEAAAATGAGVLVVEQQARRALRIADRWLLLRSGTLVRSGTSADELEAAFLSDLIDGETPAETAQRR